MLFLFFYYLIISSSVDSYLVFSIYSCFGFPLAGNIMRGSDKMAADDSRDDSASDRDRRGLIRGSLCFRSPQEETQSLFADLQTDLLVIEAMTHAVCRASKLRNVHQTAILNTIPTILCSLIANLLAVRAYEKSPSFMGQKGKPPELGAHELSRPHPKALSFVLERCIYNIVLNYYNHLARFEFPEHYQSILQQFASFHHP
jgi:hypothetical protein